MPTKPHTPSALSSSTGKKTSAATTKKPTPSDTSMSDEDALLNDTELEAVLDDEDEEEDEDDDAIAPVEAAIAAAEAPIDEDEDEEEEPVNEEEILAKGDELEILNLLAKKANRMEKGLDDDEMVPDEEGMGGF